MNTALPIHPWRCRLTQVWCCWWCSIDFPSNCCSWIYIHFLSQTSLCWFNQLNEGPISLFSCPEKPKRFQMKNSLRKSLRSAHWGQRGSEVDDLFWRLGKEQDWNRRTWRQTQVARRRNILPWIHRSVVYSFNTFIEHLPWTGPHGRVYKYSGHRPCLHGVQCEMGRHILIKLFHREIMCAMQSV